MKHWMGIVLFAVTPIVVVSVVAAESNQLAELDNALKSVVTFEHGKDSGPLIAVERIVIDSAPDIEQRQAVELCLIGALGTASTRDAKDFLCRQLRTIGTARCVSELEKLLSDPQASHMARYALGRIEDPAAGAALHRALGKTSGELAVGILNTLGDMRYRPALAEVVGLLGSSDSSVAEAAVRAAGRIGGTPAVKALEAIRLRASKELGLRINDALLVCAEQFVAEGKNDEAVRLYEKFYSPKQPGHLRLAGLRGLVTAKGAQAAPLLTEAIRSDDSDLRRSAIELMTMVKGQDATKTFVGMLPSLQPEAQELVLRALGERGDGSAAKAVSAAASSEHEAVRTAALAALGRVGDSSAIPLLLQAAATGVPQREVARASLVQLGGAGVDTALIGLIESGDSGIRVEVIRALADRGATLAAGKLLAAAKDDDESVRREAIRALGILVSESELARLVELVVSPKEAKDRPSVEQAVGAAFRRVKDKDKQAEPVLAALRMAPADAKPMLLRLLGRAATGGALEALRAALKDSNDEVRSAAVRTLSEWPDLGPADDLLAMARTSSDQTEKVIALRGYVRMAGMSKYPTALYVRAMELAERPDDKKLVLGGLGTAESAQALELVERYLKDEQLQTEAALAAVKIADRLRQKDARRARAALDNVVATVKEQRARQQAQDVINEMDQYEGYILSWLVCGPYVSKESGRDAFDTPYAPEKPDAKDLEWKPLNRGVGSWDINLEAMFGSKDHCAAYVRTEVWSPVEQDARLELGSDDALKVWLNGKCVHAEYVNRGMSPRQDIVNVKLQEGSNTLVLKVVDHEGGWQFCCRVRRPDGGAIDGLKVEAK